MRKPAVVERYCTFYCGKCCADCPNLASCKNACPKLKDKVAKIKAEAKEKRRQEQIAKEERDRPAIEQLKNLWYRFGVARNQAEKSVESVYEAASMYYVAADVKKMENMEGLWAEFNPETTLPYGYSFHLSDARKLIAVADLLGCSLDYLFCRTDVREVAQDVPVEKVPEPGTESVSTEVVPGVWYPPSVEPPTGAKIIVMDGNDYVDDDVYKGSGNLKYDVIKWPNVVRWTLMPRKED